MPTSDFNYDHPTYTTMRQHVATAAIATAGVQPGLTFRSNVKVVVTKIGVVLNSVSSNSLIMTLFHNGSAAALLTLSNSANEVAREFTLAVNRTLETLTDRLEVSSDKDKGDVSIVYDYRISPGAQYDLNAAIG